jgi:hypothetical protein
MSDYAVKVNLNDHKLGDRWLGISSIGPVIINDEQPVNELERVRCTFRKDSYSFTLDSNGLESGLILINDAATWAVSIPAVQDFVEFHGLWDWDIEFYEAGNTGPITLYKGTLRVHPDVTKPV